MEYALIRALASLGFLAWLAWQDFREESVTFWKLAAFAVFGVIVTLFSTPWPGLLVNITTAAFILFAGIKMEPLKSAWGEADAYAVASAYLVFPNILVVMGAVLFGVLLREAVLRWKGLATKAFLPFVTVGFVPALTLTGL